MIPPLGPNNDIASLASQVRDSSPQQQAPGSPIAATAETMRPTPPTDPSAASSNNDQAQFSTAGRNGAAARPVSSPLQSASEALQTTANLRQSLSSNPGQGLLAQMGMGSDPVASLLGAAPKMPGALPAY